MRYLRFINYLVAGLIGSIIVASATKYERKASYLAAIAEINGDDHPTSIGGKPVPEVWYCK